jgi:hypothetical protein
MEEEGTGMATVQFAERCEDRLMMTREDEASKLRDGEGQWIGMATVQFADRKKARSADAGGEVAAGDLRESEGLLGGIATVQFAYTAQVDSAAGPLEARLILGAMVGSGGMATVQPVIVEQ